MKHRWIIQDWAGNVCFDAISFNSFDEADEWLTEKIEALFPDTRENDERFFEEKEEYYIAVKHEEK